MSKFSHQCVIVSENRGPTGRTKTPAAKRKSRSYDKRVVADKSVEAGKRLDLYPDRLYTLIDVQDLKYWLEVSTSAFKYWL